MSGRLLDLRLRSASALDSMLNALPIIGIERRAEQTRTKLEQEVNTTLREYVTELLGVEKTDIWVPLERSLRKSDIWFLPDARQNKHKFYINDEKLRNAHPFVIDPSNWVHEVAHLVHFEQNPKVFITRLKDPRKDEEYQSAKLQYEGFANWIRLQYAPNERPFFLDLTVDEIEECETLKQKIYQSEYQLGLIIYEAAHEYGDVEEVKRLAFERPLCRRDMLRKYMQYRVETGKKMIDFHFIYQNES